MSAVSGNGYFRRITSAFALLFLLALAFTSVRLIAYPQTALAAATIYVSTLGNDTTGNGSISEPYKSITKGLEVAASGNIVSVAAGTYGVAETAEAFPIRLKSGVILQGTGASTTTIQGDGAKSVIVASSVNSAAKIDGFTITGGFALQGGGIYCLSSSPTISNNTITSNTAEAHGGGIFCEASSPVILNNTITGNISDNNGAGIYCGSSSPAVSNNVISGNTAVYGGGIFCWASSPAITNNIISENAGVNIGGGIYLNSGSNPAISNNTIVKNLASFYGGIVSYSSSPTIFNCIIWGNGVDLFGCTANYSAIEDLEPAGTGNITWNPQFVDWAGGNYRLQTSSPCIDAGMPSYNGFNAPAGDIDGYPRPQEAGYDMGAYECRASRMTIYVNAVSGNDSTGLGTVAQPYKTITKGMWRAGVNTDFVSVAAGTYNVANGETFPINLKSGVTLQGANRSTTIIQGNGLTSVVSAVNVNSSAWINSFTITGGGTTTMGGGIFCEASSLIISNNTITGNASINKGGGIYCGSGSAPTISNNTIYQNTTELGGGIYCWNSSPTISNNTINGNPVLYNGGGIYCAYNSLPDILYNTINGNVANFDGGGIYLTGNSSPAVSNNTIIGNFAADGAGIYLTSNSSPTISNNALAENVSHNDGGGIYCWESSPAVTNNAITGNVASDSGGGMTITAASSPTLSSNTITDNTDRGIGAGIYSNASTPAIFNCVIWGNHGPDLNAGPATFSCIGTGATAGEGNTTSDPLFVDAAAGDYRLRSGSPCIDKGTATGAPLTDKDGIPRPKGAGYDMGAHEAYFPIPVYRFYNYLQGVHFYTTSDAEKAYLDGPGGNWTFRFESNAFDSFDFQAPGTIPVYRFYNFLQGVHFYTANQAEATYVNDYLGGTFRYETVAYYAYSKDAPPPPGAKPVHRFYNFLQGVHFYTANQAEATNVNNNLWHTFRYEGVAYYVPE